VVGEVKPFITHLYFPKKDLDKKITIAITLSTPLHSIGVWEVGNGSGTGQICSWLNFEEGLVSLVVIPLKDISSTFQFCAHFPHHTADGGIARYPKHPHIKRDSSI